MDMGESSFLDIPSLEDLLRDPLLEGDWQFLDQEYQSANEVSANYTGSTESANDTVMHFDESQGNRLDALSPDQSIKSHTAQLDNIAIDGMCPTQSFLLSEASQTLSFLRERQIIILASHLALQQVVDSQQWLSKPGIES